MSELQPLPEHQTSGGDGGAPAVVPSDIVAGPPKRQRRPSVRLGDIGDQQTYDGHRKTKTQQQCKFSSKDFKNSKTRPLLNLAGGAVTTEYRDGGNNNNHMSNNNAIGSWKARDSAKMKRGFSTMTKRVRSNWVADENFEDEDGYNEEEHGDFDRECSDGQLNEGNIGMDGTRVGVSDGVELEGPSDTDARNWNNCDQEKNGVRVWLNQLGLGRYFPIFEVHEVDDEVLPLLTLEDLKDMGVNAVGSRRKMFCSIQKLSKGFS